MKLEEEKKKELIKNENEKKNLVCLSFMAYQPL